jgi:hypothetical protein
MEEYWLERRARKKRIEFASSVGDSRKDFIRKVEETFLFPSSECLWPDFDYYCNCLMEEYPTAGLVRKIASRDIATRDIECISRRFRIERLEGHRLYTVQRGNVIGFPDPEYKREEKFPYERDESLMHELAHIFYGHFNDSEYTLSVPYRQSEALIDWKARQWRANPTLLRKAITSFDLPPELYDLATAEAFQDLFEKQDLFWDWTLSQLANGGYWGDQNFAGYWRDSAEFFYPHFSFDGKEDG